MDRREHFARLECRRKNVDEEVLRRDAPRAVQSRNFELGIQRNRDRRPIGRWVGIGERAADRPTVAYLGIGNPVRRLAKDREHFV